MGTISIIYSSLHNAVAQTNSLSNALSTYKSKISSTVDSKFSTLASSGDKNGYISAAEQKASQKMTTMTNKSTKAATFKNNLDDFVTLAEEADKNTADNIQTLGDAVVGKRTIWQKAGDWIYNTFCVELVNKVPVVSAIANVIKGAWRKASSVMEDVHTWFKYKAGKYVWNAIKIVVGVVAAIAAAVVAVVAIIGGGTVLAICAAVAAVVLAVIAIVNGAIGIYNNIKAKKQYDEGKLGQSRYYGSIEGLSDAVSKYDMGDEGANKGWKFFGNAVDDVELVCEIVVAVEGIANIGSVKSPETGKVTGYSWDEAKKNIKKSLGFKRQRYSIDPDTGKAIKYNGEKSGYKVGDRWSFKNLFSSRQDGTGKQYFRKYLGFGTTDSVFYNSNVISGMAQNPSNTTQTVSKLFGQLKPWQKVTKTFFDVNGVVNNTIGRVGKFEKMTSGVQTAFDNQQSTWERVKGGFSAVNSFNSNMNFTKGFGNLGKVTGFVDKTEKTGETIWLQFAN